LSTARRAASVTGAANPASPSPSLGNSREAIAAYCGRNQRRPLPRFQADQVHARLQRKLRDAPEPLRPKLNYPPPQLWILQIDLRRHERLHAIADREVGIAAPKVTLPK
jgi:hypothetical protein